MNIRNLDLNLLHIFVTVYDCRSITQAAKQLHLSQPAVSNAITRLNNALELTLFVKNSRQINPTCQADSLYKDIKCCLQKIESCLSQQIHFDPATSERIFRLATSKFGELTIFPKLIPYLQKHAPHIKIVREIYPKSDFNKQLQNGKLDLVLFLDRTVETDIRKEFIFSDTLILITGPKHPPLPDKLSLADLIDLDIISFGSDYDEFVPLQSSLKRYSNYRPSRVILTSMWSAFFMVATTTLAAVVPLLLAKILQNQMGFKIHYLTDVPSNINLNLYWRDMDSQDAGHIWFRELVKNIITSELKASDLSKSNEPSDFDSEPLPCA